MKELRQSLDRSPLSNASQQQQQHHQKQGGQTLSSLPLPTIQHFMSLLRQVVTHLGDGGAKAEQEAQFKATTVASVKALTARVEQLEREKNAIETEAQRRAQEQDKHVQALQTQLRAFEQRMDQMILYMSPQMQ